MISFARSSKTQALFSFAFLLVFLLCHSVSAQDPGVKVEPPQASSPKGKLPVIVIPGLIGSELVNKQTDETVWFSLSRSKDDDLRLPISTNIAANKDNLVPGDILRNIKYLKFLPETEIYQKLAGSLIVPGGYKEGKWDAPDADGWEDTYYVFPYDWRLDNVENARLLIRKIAALKAGLKKPNLKFNIVSHSMGGLIARYAARYGDADLPVGNRAARPTWAGAKHINKIFLVGTPNEGSFSALDALVNGFAPLDLKGINIPFVQSVSKFDTFTIPAIFELLPHVGTAHVFDGDLKPMTIDLYNPATWEKYGWAAYDDPKFAKEFSATEQAQAKAYFRVMLNRAKRFQDSIDSGMNLKSPVSMIIIGADCKPTLDGIIIYKDTKKDKWETVFSPESFKQSDGTKITKEEVKNLLYSEGDGVVTKRSLLVSSSPLAKMKNGYQTALGVDDISFTCDVHNKLTGNPEAQSKMFSALLDKPKATTTNTTRVSAKKNGTSLNE